jgi:hypothetical protein
MVTDKGTMIINRKREGSFWPSKQQELLLQAALLKGEEAITAWEQWKAHADIDSLDHGSHRLLPLLYRNLHSHGVDDPSMNRLKGVYRRTWYENQMLFHTIASLLGSFQRAGIETIVLKGAALTLLFYKDFGLRPMNDFDLLVRTDQAIPAIRLLREHGWKSRYFDFEPNEGYIAVYYSHGYADNAGRELDLHWHVISQCRDANADDDFWRGSVKTEIHDVPTRVLDAADQLLHVCVHGAKWNDTPSFRWVADSMTILNNAGRIDWGRLIVQAEKLRLILPMLDTLSYLKDVFRAPVEPEILRSLLDKPVLKVERIEYKIISVPPTRWTAVLELWCQHFRLTGDADIIRKIMSFPKFLQKIWGIALWKLPFQGVLKMLTWQKTHSPKTPSQ